MSSIFDAVMPISSSTEEKWSNWGGNQSCTPAYTVRPRTEQEALDAVRFAIKKGLPVRAVGAGHSFTPVVQTGGVLLDLQHMSGLTDTDSDRNRVRMYGGTRISDVGEPLWAKGMSLTNQGDIDKQAIAGAIATATHGSGIGLGSFSSAVRWAKIINGHGEIVEVGEDDMRELKAAQVAIGTLGIMLEVELQASPAYHIVEEITYPMFDEVEKHWDKNVNDHRHYSFIWCQENGSAELYELPTPVGESMVNRTYTKKYSAANLDESTELSSAMNARRDRAYRIYAGGYMIPFHELEYYVPAELGLEAVKAVQNLLLTKHTDQKYPLEVRWVKGEDAYISPFYKRDTTVLSVSGAPGTNYWPYLQDLDALLQDFDARAHWGKIHFMNRERMINTFPEYDTFVQVRREFDPNGVFLNDHLRSLVG